MMTARLSQSIFKTAPPWQQNTTTQQRENGFKRSHLSILVCYIHIQQEKRDIFCLFTKTYLTSSRKKKFPYQNCGLLLFICRTCNLPAILKGKLRSMFARCHSSPNLHVFIRDLLTVWKNCGCHDTICKIWLCK